jgi:malonyl CoA-acyl carrier protein transacylase/NAD(P)-dependent dehydrogenase (short-subunit alcohol dehydrogenase family)
VVSVPEQDETAAVSRDGGIGLTGGGLGRQASVRAADEGPRDIFVCLAESEQDFAPALGRALQQVPIPGLITHGSGVNARLAVTFEDQAGLKAKLGSTLKMLEGGHPLEPLESQGVFAAPIPAPGEERGKLAFCFPGQGTHYITMGRQLYETDDGFRRVIDEVHDLAASAFDFDLKGSIYGDPEDEEIKQRLATLVGAQTSLFAVELGMAEVLRGMGVEPDVMVGHSFGEISALAAAGTWDLETAYEVVKARIRAAERIQQHDGPALGMMSVICSEEQRDAILKLVGDRVVLTNINAPGRFILSGERDAVERTVEVAESFGAEARLLPIASAFHSRYMEPAREPFRQALLALPCRAPAVPIMSTITGEYVATEGFGSEYLADHLSRQLVTQLNLPREINRLYDEGISRFIEVGPGWSMTKMIGAILEGRPHRAAPSLHPKVGDEETFRRARAFLMALGHLDSAAERKNVPGVFSDDFIGYMQRHEPAVLALIEEVHGRFLTHVRDGATQQIAPRPVAALPASQPRPEAAETAPEPASPPVTSVPGVGLAVWIERVREKLVATTGYPAEMLEEQLDLEADLGVDSVQRAEIWISLTTEHGLDTEFRPSGIRTIVQFAEALAELAGEDLSAPAAIPDLADQEPAAAATPAVAGAGDVSEWVERVREKLVTTTGYPAEMLEEQLDLEADLGVDSVQRAEIWISLATEHGLDTEFRPSGIRTIVQFAEALAGMAGGGAAADGPVAAAAEPAVEAPAAVAGPDVALWVERVREKLVKTTGYPTEMLEEQLDLEADLGVDSVQRAEIWISLTNEHGLDTEVRPNGIRTIVQFSEALAEMAGGGIPGASEAEPGAVEAGPDTGIQDTGCRLFTAGSRAQDSHDLEPFDCQRVLAVVGDKGGLGKAIKKRLAKKKIEFTAVTATSLIEMSESDVETMLGGCDTLLYLAHQRLGEIGDDGSALGAALATATKQLYGSFRVLAGALAAHPLRVLVPMSGDGAFGAAGEGNKHLLGSFPAGFVRCIARELEDCKFMLVDTGDIPWDQAIDKSVGTLTKSLESGLDAYGGVTPTLAPVAVAGERSAPIGEGDLVLVTGGARGIVHECVAALARQTDCRLLLTGRTALPEGQPDWLAASPEDIDSTIRQLEIDLVRSEGIGLGEAKRIGARSRAQWEVARNLKRLREDGIDARYEVCDVTDGPALAKLIREIAADVPISGVVHGAGIQRSKLIAELDDDTVLKTVSTKLDPVFTMIDELDWGSLKMFSAFGSIAGLFGNAGQSDYGLANDLLAWAVRAIKARYPQVHAQTVEWTVWVGTGMVREEEAKRFAESGLTPLDPLSGAELYLQGLLGTAHAQLAVFNPEAAFVSGRKLALHPVAARPLERLIASEGDGNPRARFSVERDVYLGQHLVNSEPVVPGTFVSDIFNEAAVASGQALRDIRFRRPLRVAEGQLEVEVLKRGDRLMLLPVDRPELGDKATANLAFATCRVADPQAGDSAGLEFNEQAIKALRDAVSNGGSSFYHTLDQHFSHALKTGSVFRGIRSAKEIDGQFYSLVTLTEDAAASIAIPGEFVFNPVLADMAVQVAVVWHMQQLEVMAIPFGIDNLYVAGKTRARDAVVVCRRLEMNEDKAVVDLCVRELDGRLILAMDGLTLKTIARLE